MPLQVRDRGRHPGREIHPGSRRWDRPHVCPERNPAAEAGETSATAAVTPWYALAVTITPVPPVWNRAMRSARSFASLPVQVNIAWAGPIGCVASSRSAYPTTPSVRYLVCVLSVASWRVTAAVTAGCECPTDGTLL